MLPGAFLSSASDIEAQELNAMGKSSLGPYDAAVRNNTLRESILWAFFYYRSELYGSPNLMTGEPDGPSYI